MIHDMIPFSTALLRRIAARIRYMAYHCDLEGTRFTLAFGAIFIGLGFAWPVAVFPTAAQIAAGQGRSTYSIMAQIAPEWAWAAAFLLQGVVMLCSLLADCRNKYLFLFDAIFGCALWTTAISACYLAYWPGVEHMMEYKPPAIMGGELAAVLASWWVLVRYAYNDERE